MNTTTRAVLLPWLPRHPRGALGSLAATVALGLVVPADRAYFGLGEDGVDYRLFPAEYLPIVLSAVLTILMAPRMPQWEKHGATTVRTLALVNDVIATATAALASLLIASGNRSWLVTGAPGNTIALSVSHVAIASLLFSMMTSALGPLLGPIASVFVIVVWFQLSLADGIGNFGPFAIYTSSLRSFWVWLLMIGAGALVLAWTRRSVPPRFAKSLVDDTR